MRITLFVFATLLTVFSFGAQADDATVSLVDTLDATSCEASLDIAETAPVVIDAEWLAGGGVPCGDSVCHGRRNTCCNASCGICTEPGGFCTQQVCD